MLSPKKTKFRKAFKGRIHGLAKSATTLDYGSFGLKALEPERVTARQIEAARRAASRRGMPPAEKRKGESSMKKFIALVMAAAMALSLAACGGEEVGPQWTTTGELVKDEDGNIVYDNVELRLTNVVTAQDKGVLEGLIGKFNRQYRDKITIISNSITEIIFRSLM